MSDDVFACRGGDTVPRVVQHLQHPGKDAEGDGPRGMRDIKMLVFIPNPDRRKASPRPAAAGELINVRSQAA